MDLPLPPFLDARDPRSFAHLTLTRRVPRMVAELLRETSLSSAARARLEEMVNRPLDLRVRRLPIPPSESAHWEEFFATYEGQRLAAMPFFLWEAYLYAWLLVDTGHYETGVDPFAKAKRDDFAQSLPNMEEASRIALRTEAEPPQVTLRAAVMRSLLANLADASNPDIQAGPLGGAALLHAEPWQNVEELLSKGSRVRIFPDNAMSELFYDLLLARTLARASPSVRIELVLKRHPMFVSDATVDDLAALLKLVEETPNATSLSLAAAEVRSLLERDRIGVLVSAELNAPWHFSAPGLVPLLDPDVLFILKGDANFRRALEDRAWPAVTPLKEACRAPVSRALFLRVLKSECVAGLEPSTLDRVERLDPGWRTNGKHATLQLLRR